MAGNDFTTAMANRSIRTIKTELEFLTDASLLSPEQLSTILSQLPSQTALHAPLQASSNPPSFNTTTNNTAYPLPIRSTTNSDPEKHQQTHGFYSPTPQTPAPAYAHQPPATPQPPPPQSQPVLVHATALYAYNPTDAGDLALAPQDRIAVTEFMNAEWWKGRSERTGLEGIFPRSYVREDDVRGYLNNGAPAPVYGGGAAVMQQQGGQQQVAGGARVPSKGEEMGKKFGKKLGNAAIFGAGATIGSEIVQSIF